ncbi:MAG TPA: amidase [Acidimicrobiales bacterium]
MDDQLTWRPAWELRYLIAKLEVSPVEVVDHFLGRIEEHQAGLHAFVHVDHEGARAQAQRAEQAVLGGQDIGPLHGVPVSVKSHVHVAGFPFMGRQGAPPARHDHLAVERLRAAGAVIVGHNSMMGSGAGAPRPTGTPGVFSSFNWDVEARNPWDPARVPGWSSSGGAASVAAGLVPLAVGTDGGGSTRLPAAYSGVVGVHPTVGLVPWVDYSRSAPPVTTTAGPLARHPLDAATALAAMAGPDGRDFVGITMERTDLLADIDAGVEGLRCAWTDDFGFTAHYAVPESDAAIATARSAAFALAGLGAEVEAVDETWEDFWPSLSVTHAVYGPISILGPQGDAAPAPEAWEAALDLRARNWHRFRHVLGTRDVLLSVTSQIVAPPIETWDQWWTSGGDFPFGTFAPAYCSHTWMFNWLGFPAASVPCGFVDGLPVGLQIVGLPGNDATVLRVANAFCKAFPRHERPPLS